jgi:hypothetical protein
MSLVRQDPDKTKNASARAGARTSARTDPKPRHIDGSARFFQLENKDPEREYVFGNRLDPLHGMGYYLGFGWRVEQLTQDGVRVKGLTTVKLGEEIEVAGMVLMSIDRETWDDIQRNGMDGQSGQAAIDAVEKRMIAQSGVRDDFRGLGVSRTWMKIVNETEALAPAQG